VQTQGSPQGTVQPQAPQGAVQTQGSSQPEPPHGTAQTVEPQQGAVQSEPPLGTAQTAEPPQGTVQPAAPQHAVETPPSQGAAQTPPPQTAVQSVAPEAAEAILGQRVNDQEGTDIGRLVDVLVDANGQPQAAVIDFGGFMGVGNRKIAVHWSVLRFNPGDLKHKVTLEMTPDQIKAAPEFLNPDKAASVVTPANTAPASTSPTSP
jgi:hypothetical protein